MSARYTARKSKEQYRAWYHVKAALRKGTLVRPETCEKCGKKPGYNRRGRSLIEAHHYRGYAKQFQLTVQWLCSICHKLEDARMEAPPPDPVLGAMVQRLRDLKAARESGTA